MSLSPHASKHKSCEHYLILAHDISTASLRDSRMVRDEANTISFSGTDSESLSYMKNVIDLQSPLSNSDARWSIGIDAFS